eukprot:Nk52_evm34s2474 gene=Nk52_evmTU34s2474
MPEKSIAESPVVAVVESVSGFGKSNPQTPTSAAEKMAELDAWSAQSAMDPRKQELLERRMTKRPLTLESDFFCIPDTVSGDGARSEFNKASNEADGSGKGGANENPNRGVSLKENEPVNENSNKPISKLDSAKKKKRVAPFNSRDTIFEMKRDSLSGLGGVGSDQSSCESKTGLEIEGKGRRSQRNTPTKRFLNTGSNQAPERQITPTSTPSRRSKKVHHSPTLKISDYFIRTGPVHKASHGSSASHGTTAATPIRIDNPAATGGNTMGNAHHILQSPSEANNLKLGVTPEKEAKRIKLTEEPTGKGGASHSSVCESGKLKMDVFVQTESEEIGLVEKLRGTVSSLEKSLADEKNLNTKLEKELAEVKSENAKNIPYIKTFTLKCKMLAKECMLREANRERKEARETCLKNSQRLCHLTHKRQGAEFKEVWEDGYAIKEYYEKVCELAQKREQVEREKKALTKRRNALNKQQKAGGNDDGFARPFPPRSTSSNSANPGPDPESSNGGEEAHLNTIEGIATQDEILKLRLSALKKEDFELQNEFEKLDIERILHVAELKRIRDEDTSRFNSFPSLNDRYLLLTLLGKGGFSEVYKAFDLEKFHFVAVKIHQLSPQWGESKKANYIKHACREYDIHRALNHPRVISLYDVFEIEPDAFATVLEYCEGKDLEHCLKKSKLMTEREARSIIVQVISALKYLNEKKPPVIHYDLKPANVLIQHGEVKITDFGLSKIMDDGCGSEGMELTSQGAGTYWYLPPECFELGKAPPKISSKVDVWSVGIIFYQCLYGQKPFGNNLSQQSILHERTILNAKTITFPNKPPVSQETKDFIKLCLSYRKEERPDVLSLCAHPYLKLK